MFGGKRNNYFRYSWKRGRGHCSGRGQHAQDAKEHGAGTNTEAVGYPRIAQIKSAAQVPLTLMGGSGTDDEDLREAIAAGISIIHIHPHQY